MPYTTMSTACTQASRVKVFSLSSLSGTEGLSLPEEPWTAAVRAVAMALFTFPVPRKGMDDMQAVTRKAQYRIHSEREEKAVRLLLGEGKGLYEAYAGDIPDDVRQKCDHTYKTQGAVRVAYGKEYLASESGEGQDIARSIGGVLHYHEASWQGVTHWTPNVYMQAVTPADIRDDNLRRVRTFRFDIDEKRTRQQVLAAFLEADVPCRPALILDTPRGVQAFVVLDDAFYGSEGAIRLARAIAIATRDALAETGLPVDMHCPTFGWSRFPREEAIRHLDEGALWSKDEAVDWFLETRTTIEGLMGTSGKYQDMPVWGALWATDTVGTRNAATFWLAVMARKDGLSRRQAMRRLQARNRGTTNPLTAREVEKAVLSAYRKDYEPSASQLQALCGERPVRNGYKKHRRPREERVNEHLDEFIARLLDHLDERLPVGEGGAMLETSARTLCREMHDGDVSQLTTMTKALRALHRHGFRVEPIRNADGTVRRGRGAGYRICRLASLVSRVRDMKREGMACPPSLQYRAMTFAPRHAEHYERVAKRAKKLMSFLPIHLGTVAGLSDGGGGTYALLNPWRLMLCEERFSRETYRIGRSVFFSQG